MGPILVPKCCQFHPNQGLQRDEPELIGGLRIAHIRRRHGAVRADFLAGKDHMHRVAGTGAGTIEEQESYAAMTPGQGPRLFSWQ